MVLLNQSTNNQQTRDELGSEPTEHPVFILYAENLKLEHGPTQIITNTEGHVWIAGSATNSVVGTWTGTEDGQQLVVGPDGDGGRVETVVGVVNPKNRFIERFKFGNFTDTDNTTATVDTTTDNRVEFTSGQIYQSKEIAKNDQTITNVNASWGATGTIKVEFSADDGATYGEVTNGELFSFSAGGIGGVQFPWTFPITFADGVGQGTVLKYKVTETGASTATFTNLLADYNQ